MNTEQALNRIAGMYATISDEEAKGRSRGESLRRLHPHDRYFLKLIEYYVQQRVLAGVQRRQRDIPGLRQDERGYLAYWGGELTPGCKSCLENKGIALRANSYCNLQCPFCYYGEDGGRPKLINEHYLVKGETYALRDLKLMLDRHREALNGCSWVYFEPFERDFEKLPEPISYIAQKGLHQWLYTNGTLVTEEKLKALSDAGLNEIRFNLAATLCSRKAIDAMALARKYFRWVCVESPVYPEFFEAFIENRRAILETGVDHIHLAELHLNSNNFRAYAKEYYFYRYNHSYISPVSSRLLTYDIFDYAVAENWSGVVLHDCSNEVKFYRGIQSGSRWGIINYEPEMELPFEFYGRALEHYDGLAGFLSDSQPELLNGRDFLPPEPHRVDA